MKQWLLIALLVLAALVSRGSLAAQSAAVLVIEGKGYKDLEFIGTNGEMVTFYAKDGPVVFKWLDLPANVRQRFAGAYDAALEQANADVLATFKAPVEITGLVIKKLNQGVLVKWNERLVILRAYPGAQSLSEGGKISVIAKRAGQVEIFEAEGKRHFVQAFTVEASKKQ